MIRKMTKRYTYVLTLSFLVLLITSHFGVCIIQWPRLLSNLCRENKSTQYLRSFASWWVRDVVVCSDFMWDDK